MYCFMMGGRGRGRSGNKPTGVGRKAKGRSRKSYFFYVSCVLGSYSLMVGYKSTRSYVQPLSASPQNAPIKVPFGPVKDCTYRERNIASGESVFEFKFVTARNQSVAIQDTLVNNLEFEVTDFSRAVTELYVENNRKLLAMFVSQINNCEDFVNHREEGHDPDGFKVSEGEKGIKTLEAAGGSIALFKQFVKVAKESALVDEISDQALEEIVRRRKALGKRIARL